MLSGTYTHMPLKRIEAKGRRDGREERWGMSAPSTRMHA